MSNQVFPAGEFLSQIEFPKEPSVSVQTVNTKAGPIDMHINMLDLSKTDEDSNMIYLSSFAQYPDSLVHSDRKEQLADFFKETLDGLVSSIDGEILSKKDIKIDSYPGKEVKINFQEMNLGHGSFVQKKMFVMLLGKTKQTQKFLF